MSLPRRSLVAALVAVVVALGGSKAEAGGFMEGIVNSVFATAEREFVSTFKPAPRPAPSKPTVKSVPELEVGFRIVEV